MDMVAVFFKQGGKFESKAVSDMHAKYGIGSNPVT